jgi:hypothetical protein
MKLSSDCKTAVELACSIPEIRPSNLETNARSGGDINAKTLADSVIHLFNSSKASSGLEIITELLQRERSNRSFKSA